MTTTTQCQAETRFVALMAELFQMDEAQALDFGFYRIIRRHNREVRAFLGEVVSDKDDARLVGGRLMELLDSAFQVSDLEDAAGDHFRLREIESQLGLKPGMTARQREAILIQAEAIPISQHLVAEYRGRVATLASRQTASQDRAEVLNRLYQFFSRHYQDGDFIVARRYGRGGARYIRSTGEDTEFHWATEDMYYIKSGDIFTDFPVRLSNGQRLLFTVEPEGLQATRATLKPNDKAHYEIMAARREGDVVKVVLRYLKGAQSDRHKDEIVNAAQKAGAPVALNQEIRRWLNRFIARNQSDFFIHKRLREALGADLDIFIKTEVLDLDQILVGALTETDISRRALRVARLVREIGMPIIDFLATLEDFQKALWEKKKLVLQTRYVITLDRLERLAPEWLAEHIEAIVIRQRDEWRALGLGDRAKVGDCLRTTAPTQTRIALGDNPAPDSVPGTYLPLPIDTGNFDENFKWSLLAAITASAPLEGTLDGVAIQSDNWQALEILREKYRERVKCIYIDPPYNTGGDGFAYKDSYQSASWMAMMEDRLLSGIKTLQPDGVLFSSIDQNEYPKLRTLLERLLGQNNALGTIVWKNVTDNNPTNVAVEHEYVECFASNRTILESEWKSPYSDAKELIVRIGEELIEKHKNQPALRLAYQDWYKANKEFLGPLEGYKFIDGGGIYAGSRSVHNPGKEGYRYDIIHPTTQKACKQPLMGYRFPEDTYKQLLADGRIIFGNDETKLIELKVYAQEYEAKLPSVIEIDGRSGANDLTNLFGEAQKFKNPKASALLQELLPYAVGKGDLIADFFVGSGTTAHALMRLNQKYLLGLRWLVLEATQNLETIVIPRIKKAAFSTEWLKGKPIGAEGPGTFVRVQALEQYEDTLENLDFEPIAGDPSEILFENPAFALRYRLNQLTHDLYSGLARFTTPFGYQLKRAAMGVEVKSCAVDLIESLAYLLGMDISRLYRESHGVVILGHNRRGQTLAIFFRDGINPETAAWLVEKLALHPADRVFTNDPASLIFEGAERLEAIEAVFARQFVRS
jgi:adenine-specific DNA-methyltransferase